MCFLRTKIVKMEILHICQVLITIINMYVDNVLRNVPVYKQHLYRIDKT